MLMEADLPEDIEALRALALDQSRKLADVTVAKGEADVRQLEEQLQTAQSAGATERARVAGELAQLQAVPVGVVGVQLPRTERATG